MSNLNVHVGTRVRYSVNRKIYTVVRIDFRFIMLDNGYRYSLKQMTSYLKKGILTITDDDV